MKYLKSYNESIFAKNNKNTIEDICKIYDIRNYTVNEDGSIDVDGSVYLNNHKLTKLPLNFRNVKGYFNCRYNELTSLKGCPESVGGLFDCRFNKLTSLEGGPKSVGYIFNCEDNQLTSLKGCPKSVGGDFYCHNNEITTFEHLPFSIGGSFYCKFNPIFNVWKLFGDYSKIEFLNDCDALREPNIIILDRLNFFLEEIGKKAVKRVKGYKCI